MKLALYQIDAFADAVFRGNPAAICPLDRWLDDALLQAIAEENNLSETAYFVPQGDGYQLRWFTPVSEVDLCGHATLASAYVLFDILGYRSRSITFDTRSGILTVVKDGRLLTMDFPARPPRPHSAPTALLHGLGRAPKDVLVADDYVAVYERADDVRELSPDFLTLKGLDLRGVIVTAPGHDVDFISRFFAPKYGINEDPVTGSSHCTLAPYWSARLHKSELKARQVSKRGGEVLCAMQGTRVALSGTAVKFLEGSITI